MGKWGQDVTVNWRSLDTNHKGVFYTDSNAYKMVRRDINEEKPYIYQESANKIF